MSCCHATAAALVVPTTAARRSARAPAVVVRATRRSSGQEQRTPEADATTTTAVPFGRRAAFASAAAAVFATSASSLFTPSAAAALLTDYDTDTKDLIAQQRGLLREVGAVCLGRLIREPPPSPRTTEKRILIIGVRSERRATASAASELWCVNSARARERESVGGLPDRFVAEISALTERK